MAANPADFLTRIPLLNDTELIQQISENVLAFRHELTAAQTTIVNLQEQTTDQQKRLSEYSSNLEELYRTKEELQSLKNKYVALLERGGGGGAPARRTVEVRVEPFDGTPSKLKAFLFGMMSKLKAEEDMYSGDVQAQLRCYVHHLTGKAREQVEN